MGWSNAVSTFPARGFYSLRNQDDVQAKINRIKRSPLMQDRNIASLAGFLSMHPGNMERMNQLLARPGVRELLESPEPFEEVPEGDDVNLGPVKFGSCPGSGNIFGLDKKQLYGGTLVVGRPGAGKTTLGAGLLKNAIAQGFCCIVIDLKRDFRSFIRMPCKTAVLWPEHLEPLLVPDGVRMAKHISMFTDCFCESLEVFQGTKNYLKKHLDKLFREREQPTIHQLYDSVIKEKHPHYSREARYQESAENRISSMLIMTGHEQSRKVFRLERLFNEFDLIVIELDRLDRTGKICYAALISGYVFEHRIENNCRNGNGKPLLMLTEEANEIYVREYERRNGGSTLGSFARQGREFDIAQVYHSHLPLDLSDNLKNVHTRILMSLGEGYNLQSMAVSMGLVPEQRELGFSLEEGQAIVRMATGYHHPFLIQCFPCALDKNISDEEVEKHMSQYLHLAEELPENTPVQVDAEAEAHDAKKEKEKVPHSGKLKSFLMDIRNRPFINLTTRYKELGLSASAGDSIRDKLLREGLCELLEINLGGRGGSAKYLAFCDAGFSALNIPPDHLINKSNFESSFWKDRLAKWAEPLGKTEIEKLVQRKHTDVGVAVPDVGLLALEVELTNAWLAENATRNLASGYVKSVHCCKDSNFEEAKGIVAGLDEKIQANVHVCLLKEITRSEPHEFLKIILNGKEGVK